MLQILLQTTTMKTRIILYFLALTCWSCSSQIMVPGWFDSKVDNKKHNWLDYQGIVIVAENIEVNDRQIVFDVEVKNETDHRLRFNPEEAYYLASDNPFPLNYQDGYNSELESSLKKHFAFSEKEVARYYENKVKSQKRANVITGILSAGLLVFDAAMASKGVPVEASSKFFNQEAIRSMVTVGGLAAMDIVREQSVITAMQASEDLHFLPGEILEEGVIMPGQIFRGKVFFPITNDDFIRMIIPVESKEFVLDFRWATIKEQRKLYRPG